MPKNAIINNRIFYLLIGSRTAISPQALAGAPCPAVPQPADGLHTAEFVVVINKDDCLQPGAAENNVIGLRPCGRAILVL